MGELVLFMNRHGSASAGWYVGTAEDARSRLFKVHGLTKADVGIIRTAATSADAASLAARLIRRGAKGDGAWKPQAASVYAFKMSPRTSPARHMDPPHRALS